MFVQSVRTKKRKRKKKTNEEVIMVSKSLTKTKGLISFFIPVATAGGREGNLGHCIFYLGFL